MSATCAVAWCLWIPAKGYRFCPQHTRRPVLHSLEACDDYLARIRREDAESKRAAEQAANVEKNNRERKAQKAGYGAR